MPTMDEVEILAEKLTRDPAMCDGGVNIASLWEKPCPKCGATEDDFCKFTGLVDPAKDK